MSTCEFCLSNTFKSPADVARHQSASKYCSEQLRRCEEQRLARLRPATYETDSESDPELGEDDGFDVIRGSSPLPDDYFDAPLPPSPVERSATPPLPAAESASASSAATEEPDPGDNDTLYQDFPGAARVIGTCTPPLAALFDVLRSASNPYAPFASKEEWELSRWAKLNPITDSALNDLLNIQGIRGGMSTSLKNAGELNKLIDSLPRQAQFKHSVLTIEGYPDEYDLFSCDTLDVLRELVGDPTFVNDIEFGAQRCYQAQAEPQPQATPQRLYNEMYASDFMWELQRKLPLGASPILIIIGSDKTQLTSFSGEHSAYPVYMSIGNISKHVRREPSKRAFRLVGYLPTLKPDETTMSEAKARELRHRLFHKAMEVISEPLFAAAENGIAIPDSKGDVRLCFPVLASYVADYPEQCLVTGVRYGQTCPKCDINVADFGAHKLGQPRTQQQSLQDIDDARNAPSRAEANEHLKQAGLNSIRPFYARWPHADMHRAQSPDNLHQFVQGVGAHVVGYLTDIMGADELDARLARLPPAHNLRNFVRGISGLTRVSGSERKAIYAQLLGGIIGRVPREAVRATRALLDFFYIVQFECHTEATLATLKTALDEFHKYKNIFQQYRAGLDFNYPKMHIVRMSSGCVLVVPSATSVRCIVHRDVP